MIILRAINNRDVLKWENRDFWHEPVRAIILCSLTSAQLVNPLLLVFNPLLEAEGQPLVLWAQRADQQVEGAVFLAGQQVQQPLHLRLLLALGLGTGPDRP